MSRRNAGLEFQAEGYDAAQSGAGAETCPYPEEEGNWMRSDWLSGHAGYHQDVEDALAAAAEAESGSV